MRTSDRSLAFRAVALGAALLLTGCQTFRPVPTSELERGDRVHLDLRSPEDVELRQVTARDVTFVDGETVEVTDTELVLSAFSVERADGGTILAEGWTVRLPLERIDGIQRQHLAVWRTAGLVAGIAVGTFVGWESLGGRGAARDEWRRRDDRMTGWPNR